MATAISLQNSTWDIYKGKYEDVDRMPLMASPSPVLFILAAYLMFVLKIGPNMMKNIEGYKLRKTLLIYNAVQVAVSAHLVLKSVQLMHKIGVFPTKCQMVDEDMRQECVWLIWLYFAAKVSELFDTIFFVLRKKSNQVTFLHVYHHSIMMFGTWAFLKYVPADNVFMISASNSLVHVVMYAYYGLAALPGFAKYTSPWKKYVTGMQLVQFVTMITHYLISLRYSECPPGKGVAVFFSFNILFFLALFSNFYMKSYTKKDNIQTNGTNGKSVKNE